MTPDGSRGVRAGLDFVERFVDVAEQFASGVEAAELHRPVAGCPGWTTYDLVVHLGNVHAWAATILETGRPAVEQNDEPRTRRSRVASEWYAAKAEDLYQVLVATDPERPTWNFAFDDGVARFWRRRQLHETTVHLMDLDLVTGAHTPVSPLIAEDGVDEVLTVFLHRMHQRGHPAVLTAPLSLATTDTGRAWTLTPRALPTPGAGPAAAVRDTGTASSTAPAVPQQSRTGEDPRPGPARLADGPPLVVHRRHPQADTVSGTAESLYRALWGRGPVADLDRAGDRERIDAFLGSRLVP